MTEFSGDGSMPIAVIGMACRFPGDATSPEKLWELLVNGRNAWSEFPKDRVNIDGFYHPSGNRQGSICFKGGHFLKGDIAAWDAPFFSITSHEAAAMDPQQRVLLEVSYEAFENGTRRFYHLLYHANRYRVAGIPMESLPGSTTGVYCGSFVKDYEQIVLRDADDSPQYAATGNGIAIMSNRISWFYDLKGPSMTLDTGCSASLVGIHLACQSLRTGEATMAMAMGAGLILTPATMMPMTALNFLSPDGKCFTFDERANGYGRGEGIGAVVLKPLEMALRDNDTIRAVIRGSSVNQDGRTPGITMPSSESQAMNTCAAYKMAGLGYDRTAYFEAHGTGTQAGDPTELRAISDTFAQARDSKNPMYVGSIKPNIGHLEGCAGIAGFVKGVLMLENGQIPQNLYFENVNPNIDLDGWKIKVPTSLTPWPMEGLRRVSINCFGFGGTNAHIIMDDTLHYLAERNLSGNHCTVDLSVSRTPSLVDSGVSVDSSPSPLSGSTSEAIPHKTHKLFIFSSHEESGIHRLSLEYSQYLQSRVNSRIVDQRAEQLSRDLAHTLASRRSRLGWKSFFVSSFFQLPTEIAAALSKPIRSSQIPRIAFVFSGQGAQWFGMGRELLQYRQFRECLEANEAYLSSIGCEWSLMTELLKDEDSSIINLPRISQPLCTALQVGLVDLLHSWNIQPSAVIGHSSGEIAAAYAVGALTRQDAWNIAFHRGRLTDSIQKIVPNLRGRMMAVALSKEVADAYLTKLKSGKAIVACINSPENSTISGDESAILELHKILTGEGIFARLLKVENAYHSAHMQIIENDYRQSIEGIGTHEISTSKIMFSSVTGQRVLGEDLEPEYWAQNMVSPVKFSDAMSSLLRSNSTKPDILLELGPHAVLQGPIKQILDAENNPRARPAYFSMLYRSKDASATSLEAVGHLWSRGAQVDIEKANNTPLDEHPHVLSDLPVYPWNHSKTYWHESHLGKNDRFRKYARQDLIGEPATESTDFEPRWRGFLRVSENPWIEHHQVQNTIIYPAAGMITMVIEGARQLEAAYHLLEGYEILNMSIEKAMIIPTTSHGLETSLTMKRLDVEKSSTGAQVSKYSFVLYSKIRDASWQRNSNGVLKIYYKPQDGHSTFLDVDTYKEYYLETQMLCSEIIIPRQLYETLEIIGMKYGSTFQNITAIKKKNNISCTTVRIPNTKATMPVQFEYPHLLHPATLDAMFQTVFVAGSEPMVPSYLESIFISAEFPTGVGKELQGYSRASRKGLRDALGNIVMFDGSWEKPRLVVKNLHFTALSVVEDTSKAGFLPNHHNLCTEIIWKEDITYAKPKSMSDWLNLAGFKNPDMAILDVTGRAGDVAVSIFKLLASNNASTPRFLKYTFVENCAKNVDIAKHRLKEWTGYIESKVSDSLNDLTQQGLKERSFDIIIANNSDTKCLSMLQKLVKLRGRIIITSLKSLKAGINDNQPLPQESINIDIKSAQDPQQAPKRQLVQPDAEQKLDVEYLEPRTKRARLNKSDIILDVEISGDSAPEKVAKQCVSETIPKIIIQEDVEHRLEDDLTDPTGEAQILDCNRRVDSVASLSTREVLILLPTTPSSALLKLSLRIREAIMLVGAKVECTSLLNSTEMVPGKLCLALLEIDGPLIWKWTFDEFAAFRVVISKSKGCLWITRGGQMTVQTPFSAPITALFRTIRSEDPQKQLYTLDLDSTRSLSSDGTGRAILSIFLTSFDSVTFSNEREYAEQGEKIYIPRAILEENLSSRIELGGSQRQPKLQPFVQEDRPLQLEVGVVGNLESLYFNDDPAPLTPLGAQDIEVEVRSIGVNPLDVKTALGQTSMDTIGLNVSGYVRKIGQAVSKFRVGDRVTAIVPGAFRNLVRAEERMTELIPNYMSFESSASLLEYVAAYYAIVVVGRLQKGESILIHTGISLYTQAAIQIAEYVGARLFMMGDTLEDEQVICEHYGLGKDYIIRNYGGGNLTKVNGGVGFDLVLNSLKGSTRERALTTVCECGRFVDLSIETGASAGTSDFLPRITNITYSTVDIGQMIQSKSPKLSGSLKPVIELFRSCAIKPSLDIHLFSIADIVEAFQTAHASNQVLKVVLKVDKAAIVPVVPREEHPLRLDEDATYILVGGLGGLGRSLAGLLVKHGAKNLAFFSRSGATSVAQTTFFQSLQEQGTIVKSYTCDICDESQVAAIIQKCAEEMPKIKGVIQAAAVIRDAIFENMTYDDWTAAIAPKIQGSWNLHKLLPLDMDFFVFLSSSAGVIGARGQSNYAAGNGFQDALAYHRRSKGLAAVSLDLGPVLGAGMVAEDEATLDILRQSGFLGVRETDFHILVSAAITGYTIDSHPTPAQVIVGTGTGGLIQQNQVRDPYWHETTLFSHMLRVDTSPSSLTSSDTLTLADMLSSAISLTEAQAIITEGLAQLLAKSMNMLPADLDIRKPATTYGVDSLVAVGTRNWIFKETGVDVSVFEILSDVSIEEFAGGIAGKCRFVSAGLRGGAG
ncbi:hypothetical protein BGZ60DRAFT_487890 [Tricladium varicosporioides]|nr:hypothetical protein BGZ60DRAFT_487890 [Hymenoscyphus varicosporioides]